MNKISIKIIKFIYNSIPAPKWLKKLASLYFIPKSLIYAKKRNGAVYYSEVGQDLFVLDTLKNKKNGYYIELGSNDPICNNNTFVLEKKYGWKGISFEIDSDFVSSFQFKRHNLCVECDATSFDYLKCFKENKVPSRVDYLQVDIDPSLNSLAALKRLPFSEYRFSTITFEHDRYSSGDAVMLESRQFLISMGYKLQMPNVKNQDRDFEDWWIDKQYLIND